MLFVGCCALSYLQMNSVNQINCSLCAVILSCVWICFSLMSTCTKIVHIRALVWLLKRSSVWSYFRLGSEKSLETTLSSPLL